MKLQYLIIFVFVLFVFCIPSVTAGESYKFVTKWGSDVVSDGKFSDAHDILQDNQGYLYVLDWANNRISKFGNDGTFIKKWGYSIDDPNNLNRPLKMCFDPSYNIYVINGYDITSYDREGNYLGTWSGANNPGAIGISSQDFRYVLEWSGIVKYDSQWNEKIRWSPFQFGEPVDIAVDKDNRIFVLSKNSTNPVTVQEYDSNGLFIKNVIDLKYNRTWVFPDSLFIDSKGYFYISSGDGLFKFDANGSFNEDYRNINGCSNVVDDIGRIYSTFGFVVTKFDSKGIFLSEFGSDVSNMANPVGIGASPQGEILVLDSYNYGRVQKFSHSGEFISRWNLTGWDGFPKLVLDSQGNVYILMSDNHNITKYSSEGTIIWSYPTSGNDISIDPRGYIYTLGGGFDSPLFIQKTNLDGEAIKYWNIPKGEFYRDPSPGGIAVDTEGNVYADAIGDSDKYKSSYSVVYKYNANGTLKRINSFDGRRLFLKGSDKENNFYLANYNSIVKYDSNLTNIIAIIGKFGYNDGEFDNSNSNGITFDQTGNLYVSDYYNCRVQKFSSTDDRLTVLMLGKYAPESQENGSIVNYTLSYTNSDREVPAENVYLRDYLPPDMEFLSASDGGQYDPVKRIVQWDLGTIPPLVRGNQNILAKIPANAPERKAFWNTANISTSTPQITEKYNVAETVTHVASKSLPTNVSVEPSESGSDSTVSVYWTTPITFRYHSCDKATRVGIKIQIDDGNPDIIAEMGGSAPDWSYTTTFAPRTGKAEVTYFIEGCNTTDVNFFLYIDPAGYIYDLSTGERIQGATVWLQWPDAKGNWTNVPTGVAPNPNMQPDTNPLITGVDGQYQWNTIPGSYRVNVEAIGYHSANSRMVNVPPPVFDLNVGLEPLFVPTNGNISVSSTPTGAQIYLDGNSTGHNTSYTLMGIGAGPHVVLLKLAGYLDYSQTVTVIAGQTASINHSLVPATPVADFIASPLTGPYPLSVHFTDNSTGLLPLTYQWSFGDGSSSATDKNPIHIYPSAGKFSVHLTVTNSAGNSTLIRRDYIDVTTPSDYNLVLGEGWNMVSVPKKLALGNDTGSIFKNVNTDGRTIWEYQGKINNWVPVNTDTPILPLYGLWVYSKYPTLVPLKFDPNPLQVPPSRNLVKGWELIGFTGTIPASARDTLISVRNDWTQAMGFDNPTYQYEVQIINGGSGQFNDSRMMYPTKGYWLFMTGPGDLSGISV